MTMSIKLAKPLYNRGVWGKVSGAGFRGRFLVAGFWWQVSRDRYCGFSGFQGAGFPRGGLREAGLSRWFPIGFHRGFRWRFHGGGFCGFGGFGVSCRGFLSGFPVGVSCRCRGCRFSVAGFSGFELPGFPEAGFLDEEIRGMFQGSRFPEGGFTGWFCWVSGF